VNKRWSHSEPARSAATQTKRRVSVFCNTYQL